MRGIRPEWEKLPKRRCDNCGGGYKPLRPLKEGQRGFCEANCRKEYHKHGGAFGPLRRALARELQKRMKDISPADTLRFERIEKRLDKLEDIMLAVRGVLGGLCG